jgi:hypothetical protein
MYKYNIKWLTLCTVSLSCESDPWPAQSTVNIKSGMTGTLKATRHTHMRPARLPASVANLFIFRFISLNGATD